jgi:predicted acylesterase/phospholipase RssA
VPARPGGQPRLRTANRTDALRDELAHRVFGDQVVGQVTHRDLATVIAATDLRTGNAVRFGSLNSSCSAYGIITAPVTVAEAVAASAAFPLLLPAMERTYTFTRPGTSAPGQHVLLLTDGGIYDNLGLSVPEPERSADPHRARLRRRLDHLLRRRPGKAPPDNRPLRRNPPAAQLRHHPRRAQDAARTKLHAAAAAGQLRGVVHAYLCMPDERAPIPVADLVPVTAVRRYPTDFKAMKPADIQRIATRGEQLTRVLIAHYCPDLSPGPSS